MKQVKSCIADHKKPLKCALKSNLNEMFSKDPTKMTLVNFSNVRGLYTMLMEKDYFSLNRDKTYCVKSVAAQSYSGRISPYLVQMRENLDQSNFKYGVSLRIQSECGKMR